MKNLMKFVIVTVGILYTTINYATIPEQFVNQFLFEEYKSKKEEPKVVVRNKRGAVIYNVENSDKKSKVELVKDLNLPTGNYTFEMDESTKLEIIPFLVEKGDVVMDVNNSKTIFKPTLQIKDDLVLVNQLSLLNPLKIILSYNSMENTSKDFKIIHVEKISKKLIAQRIYNLDKSMTGTYKVKLISDGRVFTETFSF